MNEMKEGRKGGKKDEKNTGVRKKGVKWVEIRC